MAQIVRCTSSPQLRRLRSTGGVILWRSIKFLAAIHTSSNIVYLVRSDFSALIKSTARATSYLYFVGSLQHWQIFEEYSEYLRSKHLVFIQSQ